MKKSILLKCIVLLCFLTADFVAFSQSQEHYKLRKICIDAGHGGKDPGAIGKISKEKNICLSIALKAGKYISENLPDLEVIYTRDKDVFVELGKRPDYANENQADLFISIHINSCNNKKVHGASTYVVGETRKNDNFALALTLQENGGELFQLSSEDSIMLAGLNKVHKEQSLNYAGKVQKQFRERMGRKDLGVKDANFAVLWRAQMPAVLIECGFISNAAEEKFMASSEGQDYYASAIYRAVKEYGKDYDPHFLDNAKTYVPGQKTQQDVVKQQNVKTDNNQNAAPEVQNKPGVASNENNVYYKVQLKSSPVKVSLSDKSFKGLLEVEENFLDGNYKYTVGKTQSYSEIVKLQSEVRKKIPDAFVIAVKNGNQKISITEAKKILSGK